LKEGLYKLFGYPASRQRSSNVLKVSFLTHVFKS
jgi:hypothetical protein